MTATPHSEPATSAASPATSDRKVVIKCAALTKVFKDFWMRPRVRAVNNIDLEIHDGQVFGLLGPNGSGKSTTIKMILGLLHPTSGRIAVLGHRPEDVKTKKDIGYLPEESYLYRFLNARETLDYYGRLFHQPRRTRRARIDMLLEMVGLEAAQNRPVGEYSKGMQRRIGIAQALINDPKLLILDEPTTGMDPIGTRQIKDLLIRLRERGKTILLCSHLLADVEDVCDRVSIMFGGKVVANGTLDELLVDQQTTTLQTENLDDATLKQIEKVLEQHGKHLGKVSRPRQSLENKFLDLVHSEQTKGSETSGARAGGKIAGFLMDGERSGHMPEDIEAAELLNKLTEPVSDTRTNVSDRDGGGVTSGAEGEVPETVLIPASTPEAFDEGVLNDLSDSKSANASANKGGGSESATANVDPGVDAGADLSVLDGLVVPSASPVVSDDVPSSSDPTDESDGHSAGETKNESTDVASDDASDVNEPDPVAEADATVTTDDSPPAPDPEPEPTPMAEAEEPPQPLVSERSGESGTNLADAVEVDEDGHEIIKPKPGQTPNPSPNDELNDLVNGDVNDGSAPRVSESGETPDESFIEALRNLNKGGKPKGGGPKDA